MQCRLLSNTSSKVSWAESLQNSQCEGDKYLQCKPGVVPMANCSARDREDDLERISVASLERIPLSGSKVYLRFCLWIFNLEPTRINTQSPGTFNIIQLVNTLVLYSLFLRQRGRGRAPCLICDETANRRATLMDGGNDSLPQVLFRDAVDLGATKWAFRSRCPRNDLSPSGDSKTSWIEVCLRAMYGPRFEATRTERMPTGKYSNHTVGRGRKITETYGT